MCQETDNERSQKAAARDPSTNGRAAVDFRVVATAPQGYDQRVFATPSPRL